MSSQRAIPSGVSMIAMMRTEPASMPLSFSAPASASSATRSVSVSSILGTRIAARSGQTTDAMSSSSRPVSSALTRTVTTVSSS